MLGDGEACFCFACSVLRHIRQPVPVAYNEILIDLSLDVCSPPKKNVLGTSSCMVPFDSPYKVEYTGTFQVNPLAMKKLMVVQISYMCVLLSCGNERYARIRTADYKEREIFRG